VATASAPRRVGEGGIRPRAVLKGLELFIFQHVAGVENGGPVDRKYNIGTTRSGVVSNTG
jgi:hypothetical protein